MNGHFGEPVKVLETRGNFELVESSFYKLGIRNGVLWCMVPGTHMNADVMRVWDGIPELVAA